MSALRLPAILSVALLGAACGDDTPSAADAGVQLADARPSADAAVTSSDASVNADASGPFDAGCQVFEEYDPASGRCIPVA